MLPTIARAPDYPNFRKPVRLDDVWRDQRAPHTWQDDAAAKRIVGWMVALHDEARWGGARGCVPR